MYSSRTFLEL
uniref:Uncharacterized protein n=1 Tax=Arundo donax TaxID=35708 RepID=A0A0A9F1L2_ARUDO